MPVQRYLDWPLEPGTSHPLTAAQLQGSVNIALHWPSPTAAHARQAEKSLPDQQRA